MPYIQLHWIDYAILATYFAFVLGIGFQLRQNMQSAEDYLLSGRAIPAWIAGLAFLSANLGAQEVMGMAASGAKYGIATSHFYWVGAVPAMVFVGVFMMPFYYGSRARSVPEYLKLRFDEKTRAFNAVTFALMTVMSSGISLYAMGLLLASLLGWNFDASIALAALVVRFVNTFNPHGIWIGVLGFDFLEQIRRAILRHRQQKQKKKCIRASLWRLTIRKARMWREIVF